MIELYQAEWCPTCRRVRQRLTENGIDFIARQVEPLPEDRHRLFEATGVRGIPTLITESGDVVNGDEAFASWFDSLGDEPSYASAHREKAKKSLAKLVAQHQ